MAELFGPAASLYLRIDVTKLSLWRTSLGTIDYKWQDALLV